MPASISCSSIFERVNQRRADRAAALVDRAPERRLRADAAADEGARRRLDRAGRDVLRRRALPQQAGGEARAPHAAGRHRAQKIGVPIGAGTDAHRVASYNPFTALQWFLDGKTVGGVGAARTGGDVRSRRRAALLHASAAPGSRTTTTSAARSRWASCADLAVLSQDYMTAPVDQIGAPNRCSPWSAARWCTPRRRSNNGSATHRKSCHRHRCE